MRIHTLANKTHTQSLVLIPRLLPVPGFQRLIHAEKLGVAWEYGHTYMYTHTHTCTRTQCIYTRIQTYRLCFEYEWKRYYFSLQLKTKGNRDVHGERFLNTFLYGTDLRWYPVELCLSPSQTTWLIITFTYAPDSRDSEVFGSIEVGSLEGEAVSQNGWGLLSVDCWSCD